MMKENNVDYDNKVQKVVKNKIKTETVKIRGRMMTREIVEKEWNIPKIINTDIGFQLMFGFRAPVNTNKQTGSIQEVSIDYLKNR